MIAFSILSWGFTPKNFEINFVKNQSVTNLNTSSGKDGF